MMFGLTYPQMAPGLPHVLSFDHTYNDTHITYQAYETLYVMYMSISTCCNVQNYILRLYFDRNVFVSGPDHNSSLKPPYLTCFLF